LGIVASLLLSSGATIVQNIVGSGGSVLYTVQETRMYSGAVTEESVYLKVDNFNGPVTVSTWDRMEYSVNVTIRAKDMPMGNAANNLATFKTSMESGVVSEVRRLVLRYDVPIMFSSVYAVEVRALLPQATLGLDLTSSNGGLILSKVSGTSFRLETSNGLLGLDEISVDELIGSTSNGLIEGTVNVTKAALSTSNGAIQLSILGTNSGDYDLKTSNGLIKLTVPSSQNVGYSLDLSTSNAAVSVGLQGLNYSVDQRTTKKGQTTDFGNKQIQLTIKGTTSNGNIDVGTS